MTTCAVYKLDTCLIINLIVAKSTDPCPYPDCALVDTTGYTVAIAYSWDGTNFLDYYGNIVPPNPTQYAVYKLDTGLIIELIMAIPTDHSPYPDCALISTTGYTVYVDYTWDGTNFLDFECNIVLPKSVEEE